MTTQPTTITSASPDAPRVLVVDDEPAIRTIVRRTLERVGYVVDEADDPLHVCETIDERGHLDLLVSDFRMPKLTGDEVARRCRRSRPDLKVLFITGFADDLFDDRRTLWEGEAFLEKPFNRDGLLEATSLLLFGSIRHDVPSPSRQTTGGGA